MHRLGGHVGVVLLAVVMAGCGDETPTHAVRGSEWQAGVFESSTLFRDLCETPRVGVDPATNRPYPDVQGSTTDENNFLRSYSNETYLWYDEIVDQNPALFDDPVAYFDQLRTTALAPSGQPKDRFHFTIDSEEWNALSQSGVSAGYGAQWALISSTPPREVLVAYTEPNSPATDVALERGARVLSVDGFDIDTTTLAGIDALNAGLFPSEPGETHTFEVQDVGSQGSRSVTMTSANIESQPVLNVQVLETGTERVGYVLFNDHIATAELGLVDAVNQLNEGEGVDDLVLDLRYNGGGFLVLASQLSYMIAGPGRTTDRTFELQQFNDQHPDTNPLTGQPIVPLPFIDVTLGLVDMPPDQPLPTLDLPRVFVISGPGTCSASEAIINGLRGVDVEVIQIGSTTCGKPYGFYPTDNCGTTYFTIQFRGANDQGFGDYSDGFSPENTQGTVGTVVPGCSVADDFTAELGDPSEARLFAALSYRDSSTCPEPSGLPSGVSSKSGAPLGATDGIVPKSPWQTNRIMIP